MTDNLVTINEAELIVAAEKGFDEFVDVFVEATYKAIGGQLDAEAMQRLNAHQVTLLAYRILRDEVMDGGFVQLIHNGYGPFIFKNPFARMMREWGIDELATLVNKAHRLYKKHHVEIEKECGDDEFMALFEQFAQFDECDDCFVEHEEEWTTLVAAYVDEHIDRFATVMSLKEE